MKLIAKFTTARPSFDTVSRSKGCARSAESAVLDSPPASIRFAPREPNRLRRVIPTLTLQLEERPARVPLISLRGPLPALFPPEAAGIQHGSVLHADSDPIVASQGC